MHLIARIPVMGYTPGQTIYVDFEVDNKSNQQALFSTTLWKVRFHPAISAFRFRVPTNDQ